jgi:hypothetical protein
VTGEAQRGRKDAPVAVAALVKKKKKPRNWDELYQALVEYKEQNGDCNVPTNRRKIED